MDVRLHHPTVCREMVIDSGQCATARLRGSVKAAARALHASEWRRWEPHIHAPGTVMNNQYRGPTAWDDYLSALEAATPTMQAIAVTDYYFIDTYQEILKRRAAGRLPDAKLIFPNVELRLDVATSRGGFVNLHLF